VVNLFMIVAIFDAAARVLSPESFSGYWTGGANTPIVSILSHFLVYILLIKLFDRRGSRDEAHIVSLSVFVVVGAILTSNSLTVGILILLFTPSVIACSMLMQLVAGALAVEDQARRQDLEAIDALCRCVGSGATSSRPPPSRPWERSCWRPSSSS
jgi:hypothetical protein